MPHLEGHAAGRYEELRSIRLPWEDAAERFSLLTLPSIFPIREVPVPDQKVIPHNNTGSQGVNTLASKMVLQLLPPQQPFFRMVIKPEVIQKVRDASGNQDPQISGPAQQIETELQESLIDLENRLVQEIGRDNLRANAHEVFKQLLVAGNVVFWIPDKGATSVITLRRFVVARDPSGELIEVIIKESMNEDALPEAYKDLIEEAPQSNDPYMPNQPTFPSKTVDVYTVVERYGPDKFTMWQEIAGKQVPDSKKDYTRDTLPLLVLRWTSTPGEDYGHSFVSDLEGDLVVLEAISKAIKEAAVAAARVVFGVGLTAPPGLASRLSKAANGSWHRFSEKDVFAFKLDKNADLNIAAQTAQAAEGRLRGSFLLNATRQAERVTAEEIRRNFQELQSALGGAFSQLSNTFQAPLLRRLVVRLKRKGGLAGIDNALSETEPIIITGVDALGRNTEFSNLVAYTQALTQVLGPQGVAQVLDESELALRMANSAGVKADGLVKDMQQIQQERQQASLTQAGINAAGPAAGAAVRGLAQQAQAQTGPGQDQQTQPDQPSQ